MDVVFLRIFLLYCGLCVADLRFVGRIGFREDVGVNEAIENVLAAFSVENVLLRCCIGQRSVSRFLCVCVR